MQKQTIVDSASCTLQNISPCLPFTTTRVLAKIKQTTFAVSGTLT